MIDRPKTDFPRVETGILGGTGLYQIDGLEILQELDIETPFGPPSDTFMIGNLAGASVAFLTRHGRGHPLLPTDINFRANICAFKLLGVKRILAAYSVGSLKEELPPRDIVIPDQFIDRSRRRNTFFGDGAAAHVGLADPVCSGLADALFRSGRDLGLGIHAGGTYVCIEGPAFSTRAESRVYRSWGCDIIGMTAATEAKLAREAEICYAPMAMVTDYDVWRESEDAVSIEMIMSNMEANTESAKAVIKRTLGALPAPGERECACGGAMQGCLVTRPDMIPPATRARLRPIIGKYLGEEDQNQ